MLKTKDLLLTVGLEIHSQINTAINSDEMPGKKLFSHSSNNSSEDIPNSQINFFDLAIPGTMPKLNLFAVQQAVKTGLALKGTICTTSEFDRKHYFYPDLPCGYQITQYHKPIIMGGHIILNSGKKIRIHHIHMEADAGQNSHKDTFSLTNLNRAMVGLMEIVTEPDMCSVQEVVEFIKTLRLILRYIKTCDGNMEEGNFRVDVNISIRFNEEDALGTRVEYKNINSFKFIEAAINHEIERQLNIINEGGKILQETRGFDGINSTSYSLRKKENAPEYRYMWEPNLPPLVVTEEFIKAVENTIEELPQEKRTRYKAFGMEDTIIDILLDNIPLQDYLENLIKISKNQDLLVNLSNWLVGDLYGISSKHHKEVKDYKAEYLISIVEMIHEEKISGKVGKYILNQSIQNDKPPISIVREENLWQITDTNLIDTYVREVLQEQSKKYMEYKATNDERIIHFLTGCVIKKTEGKGAPNLCRIRLINYL